MRNVHPTITRRRSTGLAMAATAFFSAMTGISSAHAVEPMPVDIFEQCGLKAFEANPTPEAAEKFNACLTEAQKRLIDNARAEVERVSPNRGPKHPCDVDMFEIPSHGGLPHRLFEKLNEGNVGEAHALLASPLRAIITVSQLAAHIDGMLWPGKRIRDAKGLRQMSFGGFGCIDGRLAIRDDIDLTYESAAAVTVVVHSVQENGDWRIATIERVSSAAGAAEPATGERP